jgi:hypothetical protein
MKITYTWEESDIIPGSCFIIREKNICYQYIIITTEFENTECFNCVYINKGTLVFPSDVTKQLLAERLTDLQAEPSTL